MDESREEITVDGEPLHQRLAVRAPDLAAGLVARLIDEVPVYASLPPEELRRDITQIAEHGIRMFLGVLRSGRQPDGGELAELRHSAARRAEEGIPLESVVDAYFIGTEQCFEAMMATARPEDVGAVLATHRLVMRHLRQVTAAVAAGYTEEVRASLSEENGARQALLTALLDGEAAAQAADRAGLGLAPSYLVLSMGIGDHPDERAPGVDPTIAARRKLRRLRAELDHEVRGHALATLTPKDGLALLPREVPSHTPVAEDGGRLAGLVGRLSRRCGAELLVGAVAAGPEDIVRAAPLAAEIRAVAEAGGRPPRGVPARRRAARVPAHPPRPRPGPTHRHPPAAGGPSDRPGDAARLHRLWAGPAQDGGAAAGAPTNRGLPAPQSGVGDRSRPDPGLRRGAGARVAGRLHHGSRAAGELIRPPIPASRTPGQSTLPMMATAASTSGCSPATTSAYAKDSAMRTTA